MLICLVKQEDKVKMWPKNLEMVQNNEITMLEVLKRISRNNSEGLILSENLRSLTGDLELMILKISMEF